jgi:hypothetical protein
VGRLRRHVGGLVIGASQSLNRDEDISALGAGYTSDFEETLEIGRERLT